MVVLAAVASAIMGRIFYIQVFQAEKWRKIAATNGLKYKQVKATRGNVLSGNGQLLATSVPFYRVAFDPSAANDDLFNEGIDSLAVLLAAQEFPPELLLAKMKHWN